MEIRIDKKSERKLREPRDSELQKIELEEHPKEDEPDNSDGRYIEE